MKGTSLFRLRGGGSLRSSIVYGSASRGRVGGLALTILLLIVASQLLGFPVSPVRGQLVGLVCLAPSGATACPAPPVTVSALVGSQLMVAIIVQGSDSFSGFDITLDANHTALVPTGVSLAGSLLSGGTILVECLGRALKAGPLCPSTDNVDTLEFGVVQSSLTFAPTTGLLFTAIYNVTGTVATQISYQTGCSGSSVTGTTACVVFANGSLAVPMESVQTATYTVAPTPTFTLQSSQSAIFLGRSETGNLTITVASLNGFVGNVTFSMAFSPIAKRPPSFSIAPLAVSLSDGGFNTAYFIISTRNNTTKTTYNVMLTATGGSISDSIEISVIVLP